MVLQRGAIKPLNKKENVKMKNNLELLKDGKILVWGSNFPRYYKLEGNELLWSDNLFNWSTSNASLNWLEQIDFEIYE